jgi:hypothetical protein
MIINVIPGTEVPGYSRGVPLGRENGFSPTSGNVSITDDVEPRYR